MLYDFLLPTETRRNYEAKPPLRGSPLATKGSPRLVSFYSWVMFCLDFVCMLVMFQTTGHPSEVTDFLGCDIFGLTIFPCVLPNVAGMGLEPVEWNSLLQAFMVVKLAQYLRSAAMAIAQIHLAINARMKGPWKASSALAIRLRDAGALILQAGIGVAIGFASQEFLSSGILDFYLGFSPAPVTMHWYSEVPSSVLVGLGLEPGAPFSRCLDDERCFVYGGAPGALSLSRYSRPAARP